MSKYLRIAIVLVIAGVITLRYILKDIKLSWRAAIARKKPKNQTPIEKVYSGWATLKVEEPDEGDAS